MDVKGILWVIIFGAVAGWIVSLIVGGGGLVRNIIVGLVGAVVGSFIFGNIGLFSGSPILNGLVSAVLGGIIVVVVARILG